MRMKKLIQKKDTELDSTRLGDLIPSGSMKQGKRVLSFCPSLKSGTESALKTLKLSLLF